MIREVELKYKFSGEQDFLAALHATGVKPETEFQTNHFFDTPDLKLKAQHIFLRLRKSNDQFVFTCKAPPIGIAKPSDMLSIHDEWEEPLEHSEAQHLVNGSENPKSLLSKAWPNESKSSQETRLSLLGRVNEIIKDEPLSLAGSFKNTRYHVPYSIDTHELDFEFDATDFGHDRLDYELEIELPESLSADRAQAELASFFENLEIQTSPSTGKAERFFAHAFNTRSLSQ